MKSYILTEGSEKIGFGHITRCTSLYDELKKKKLNPKFIVNGDKSTLNLLKNKKNHIFDWVKDDKKRNRLIQNSHCIIIDSYLAKKKDYLNIAKQTKHLICIDDDNRISYPPSIITNGSMHADSLKYKKLPKQRFLLGNQYILLRKEFQNIGSKIISKEIKSLFLAFGGDDLRNLTPRILKLVSDEYPLINKIVIIPPSFKKSAINKIKQSIDSKTKLVFSPSALEMKKYMQKSDLAISASGQTLNELARIGLPTIGIIVIDNQRNNALGWKKRKFIVNAGDWNDVKLEKNILLAIKKLASKKERQQRSKTGQKYVDGKGPERLIKYILN